MTFGEILDCMEISRATLNTRLKSLLKQSRILRIVKGKRIAYISDEKQIGRAIDAYLAPLGELSAILEKQKGAFFNHLIMHFVPEYLEFVVKGSHTQIEEIKGFVNDWFSQQEGREK